MQSDIQGAGGASHGKSVGVDMQALGAAVRRKREALGWTRYRLARRAGMFDVSVRWVELGLGQNVQLRTIVCLVSALDMSVDDLLRQAGIETPLDLAPEIKGVYQTLGTSARRTWLRVGHILTDLERDHETLYGEPPREETEGSRDE